MTHFQNYLDLIKQENPEELVKSIKETKEKIISDHIKTFNYTDHITGLLLGNVQSGKTSQVFGIISACADEGFKIFILLTSDNVYLQQQTITRALSYLDTFNVCHENDEIRFYQNNLRKPTLIILKKNASILKKWNNNLSSSGFCNGNPIFIIDDEGDASSLNTKVNKDEISSINKYLSSMKAMSSSSIYLQVTATPQALLLQTKLSGWKPSFIQYFSPGKNYLGGDFFYSVEPVSSSIRFTDDNELDDLLNDDEFPDNGLIKSLISFLISASHLYLSENKNVCNFLIHPSVRIDDQEIIADKIGAYLNRMIIDIQEDKFENEFREIWNDIQTTKKELVKFEDAIKFIKKVLHENIINIMVMNSKNKIGKYNEGLNVIVGGNSLGRGVTFPSLHTVYYCRKAKSPQADTFWQHCRVFGYDRDKDLVRVFIPPFLFKLFSELHASNKSLIAQIQKNNINEVNLIYAGKIKPTRKNVIDQDYFNIIVGGTDYFPIYPKNKDISKIDKILSNFNDDKDYYTVNLNIFIKILELVDSDDEYDWPKTSYIQCIKSLIANEPGEQGILIIRKDRDISKGTGTLLSPNDRLLGKNFNAQTVLILYRIKGQKEKGWEGNPIWIPNIKFPEEIVFYKTIG